MSGGRSAVQPEQAEAIRLLQEELAETNSEVIALTLELERRLEGLRLLHTITRAIGERQDLYSIFQVVVHSLEDSLPIDLACIYRYDPATKALIASHFGTRAAALTHETRTLPAVRIALDGEAIARCAQGELIYEPYLNALAPGLQQRLAAAGLRSLVAAPLGAGTEFIGAILAARRTVDGFSRDERTFLKQLGEHVALAARQAQLREALQSAYEDLRQSQQIMLPQERLRALGEMASGVAHDINNAISPITLYVDLLKRDSQLSAGSRGYVGTIELAIEGVASTISRLRQFYCQHEPQLALGSVDLNVVVQQAVEFTRARWRDLPQRGGTPVELGVELGADLPPITGAQSEIRDALINLVFNAVDALPSGGHVWLRTGPVRSSQETLVALEVKDDGVGMDEPTRRRCLEPFFTTKGARGSGMGLAMVYGMAQRHSAEIVIESAPGAGTSVRLIFPIGRSTRPAVTSQGIVRSTGPLRLLIIDDDPMVIASVRAALESDGHEVDSADGGQAGIDAYMTALASAHPFSVVITDLSMPGVDGRAVAAAVKAACAATPVLLLTGWGRQLQDSVETPAHVDRVLSKPPRLLQLRQALAELTGP
jgi:signal transduction histidine kinase/ActR/RegA family two-component response regulator